MQLKRLGWLLLATCTFCGAEPASDSGKIGGPLQFVGVVTAGLVVITGLKYVRDVLIHWTDRRLIGNARAAFISAEERYNRVIFIHQAHGVGGLRDYIVGKDGGDAFKLFSSFVRQMRQTVVTLESYLAQLAYLENKGLSAQEVSLIHSQIVRGRKLVEQLQQILAEFDRHRSYLEIEVVLRGGLPSKNIQNPFQTLEYVRSLQERMRFLKKRTNAIKQSKASDDEQGRSVVKQARAFLKRLEAEIAKISGSEEYRQELRLKRDTDLAQERIKLERDRFALEKKRLAIEEEKARELRRKNNLEQARLEEDSQEKADLKKNTARAEQLCSAMQKQINEREAYIAMLQKKIALLEEQKQKLQLDLAQKSDNRYQQEVARIEKRLCALQEKINRLKALVQNPPMNPNHPDYARFLEQQVRNL